MKNYRVNRTKWNNLNIFEQLGNIGSEVGRSFNAIKKGDKNTSELAMIRALDLFDATTTSLLTQKDKKYRLKEVLRSKDQYLRAYFNHNSDEFEAIENYFTQFAYASRLNRK